MLSDSSERIHEHTTAAWLDSTVFSRTARKVLLETLQHPRDIVIVFADTRCDVKARVCEMTV